MYHPSLSLSSVHDKVERTFGTFSAEDACNFALNIYDEGAVLSVVVDAGSHGTHVAGITSAHHPDEPGLNGIAPGNCPSDFMGSAHLERITNLMLHEEILYDIKFVAGLVCMCLQTYIVIFTAKDSYTLRFSHSHWESILWRIPCNPHNHCH